jgi:polygalacturonase
MLKLLVWLVAAVAWQGFAQDTRQVTEPAIPPSCAVLTARLASLGERTLAEADEDHLDTGRIQSAIDGCPKGQAVELKAGRGRDAFLSAPLHLRDGVTLRVDAGAILFGSRNPRDYDVRPGSCGIVDQDGHGCRALVNGDRVAHAAVMGDGVIDGRGWARLIGTNVTWWELAERARVGGFQNCPRLIVLSHSSDFTLYRITLKNSGNFHVYFEAGDGFTAWGVVIDTPKTARNTDGIDPAGSKNVTIAHCYIHTGDDQVAIKAAIHSSHITVAHNHFYTGHGMSIGSEASGGATGIRVTDLSIDGADNGIRIKSNSGRGGPIQPVVSADVCIRNTRNPILMDTDYAHYGRGGARIPVFSGIVLRDVRVLTDGKITLQGYDETHRLGMTFDNVYADAQPPKVVAAHADLALGPGPVNFRPGGEDVTLTGTPGTGAPNACQGKFVPLPRERPGQR